MFVKQEVGSTAGPALVSDLPVRVRVRVRPVSGLGLGLNRPGLGLAAGRGVLASCSY